MYVSMPYIGPTPFLLLKTELYKIHKFCFNALYRANSISTKICRFRGRFHFHVSMPYIGPTPFLQVRIEVTKTQMNCFNALYRANSISTLGAGKPHKHWLPRAIFTRNSQNILINRFFNLKIGLLTLCSYL